MAQFKWPPQIVIGLCIAAAAPGLMGLSDGPQTTPQATSSKPLPKCVDGPFKSTTVIDSSTLMVEGRGGNYVTIYVEGCALNDSDPVRFVFHGSTKICDPVDVDMDSIIMRRLPDHCFASKVLPVSREEAQKFLSSPTHSDAKLEHH